MLLLTLRGTPFIYYGEELAMRTDPPGSIEEVRDPVGRRFWPGYKDGTASVARCRGTARSTRASRAAPRGSAARTMRQAATWKSRPPIRIRFSTSIAALLRVRRASPALNSGDFQALDANKGVLAYTRTNGGERLMVVMNFMDRSQDAFVRASGAGAATVLLGSHRQAGASVAVPSLRLQPLESVILQP